MNKFQPHIIPEYPKNNLLIFEEWFAENYKYCNTDRELLPVFFTSYYVNNNYGNDLGARKELQDYLNSLDVNKKYFSVIQYDDAILDDVRHLDLLQFNMSKTYDVPLPLICQPHPYKFSGEKKYFASFVGGRTHPIRDGLEQFKNKEDWYVSYELHNIERYCEIMSQSIFTICPRGYGINSFRITEALQYGSIPVYVSDDFVNPFFVPFYEYGVTLHSKHINFLAEELERKSETEIAAYQDWGKQAYELYYTYDGCCKHIIAELENEYHRRQQVGTLAPSL